MMKHREQNKEIGRKKDLEKSDNEEIEQKLPKLIIHTFRDIRDFTFMKNDRVL